MILFTGLFMIDKLCCSSLVLGLLLPLTMKAEEEPGNQLMSNSSN